MQLISKSEERLIHRHRSRMHTILRRIWYVVSTLCTLIAVVMVAIVFTFASQERKYRNSLGAVSAVSGLDRPSTFTIVASQYSERGDDLEEERMVEDQMRLFRRTLDSLGLSPTVMGFDLHITAVPFGEPNLRRCTSRYRVFSTSCGCERDTLNVIALEIDSTGTRAHAIYVKTLASKDIQP